MIKHAVLFIGLIGLADPSSACNPTYFDDIKDYMRCLEYEHEERGKYYQELKRRRDMERAIKEQEKRIKELEKKNERYPDG